MTGTISKTSRNRKLKTRAKAGVKAKSKAKTGLAKKFGNLSADSRLQRALNSFPKIIKEEERNFKAREKDIARFAKLSKELSRRMDTALPPEAHPWRICGYGEHLVKTHPLRTRPSRMNPVGGVTTRHAHCAKNKSGKDHLFPFEIQEISKKNFGGVSEQPCPQNLGFANGNKYDSLIAGWVKYWNETLKPQPPLEPNLVKALIATESRFLPTLRANPKNVESGRGLIQVTGRTRRILSDPKGELHDHYIDLSPEDLDDPNLNICAGVRWLIYKKAYAANKLKREASWLETIYFYKGLARASKARASKARADELMARVISAYETLKKCTDSDA